VSGPAPLGLQQRLGPARLERAGLPAPVEPRQPERPHLGGRLLWAADGGEDQPRPAQRVLDGDDLRRLGRGAARHPDAAAGRAWGSGDLGGLHPRRPGSADGDARLDLAALVGRDPMWFVEHPRGFLVGGLQRPPLPRPAASLGGLDLLVDAHGGGVVARDVRRGPAGAGDLGGRRQRRAPDLRRRRGARRQNGRRGRGDGDQPLDGLCLSVRHGLGLGRRGLAPGGAAGGALHLGDQAGVRRRLLQRRGGGRGGRRRGLDLPGLGL
jgi:hypothetical protein